MPMMGLSTEGEQRNYGCLFCRSGSEERIILELEHSHPNMFCISPKRVRVRRQGEKELATLFPGYIFFNLTSHIDFRTIIQRTDIYKVLQYPTGDWRLMGSDLLLAEWLFDTGGVIGLSSAVYKDDGIKIISGPLKDYKDRILKLNKRAKTAQVSIDFHGKKLIMWLGFEIEDK